MDNEIKAKLYDEALERAKYFQEKFGGDYAGYIFPELKEREDERIKSAILKAVLTDEGIEEIEHSGFEYADIKSYLEKQKDLPTDEEMKATLRMEYEKGRADAIAEMSSAEWSEEDEKRLRSVIHRIEVQFGGNLFGEGKIDVDWLKSLSPQPKENTLPVVRTKEIDEQMFNNIIARFDGEHFKYEMLQAMRTWLIELRERLRWKPSEEQMQALVIAIDESKRCEEPYWRDSLHGVLLGLHDDLKKLL